MLHLARSLYAVQFGLFFIFFPVVVVLYFVLPHKARWLHLLVASCVFYAVLIPAYLLLLFALIGIDYASALLIYKSAGRRRKSFLLVSICATCAMLFTFKYFNFFSVNTGWLLAGLHVYYVPPLLKLALPIGLSFHTFQSLSYVVEVYRGRQAPERHLGIYALYVMFFPQLVAGPIERPQNLLHQFHERHAPDYARVAEGLRQMLLGYFKKMVIADNLAPYVNQVYQHPAASSSNMIVLASLFFSIQIYCDFSGYSDIAIGAARIMGFDLMTNFYFPYSAKSINEFWRRWHISLSTWFRDYVFIPLGGNRVSRPRLCYNLLIVFLLSALWHGAGWTFIIWGMLHAFYMIAGIFTQPVLGKMNVENRSKIFRYFANAGSRIVTFFLVTFAWVFFRAPDLHTALELLHRCSFHPATLLADIKQLSQQVHLAFPERVPFLYVLLCLALFAISEYVGQHGSVSFRVQRAPRVLRWCLYYGAVACILFFGVYDVIPSFIYFQF